MTKRLSLNLKRRVGIGILVLIVFVVVGVVIWTNFSANKVRAAWFDENYGYRQTVAITNAGLAQTDFQVSITLDTATLISAGKMQSDCDDLRITQANGELLPHWIDKGNMACNTSISKIWVKLASIPTTETKLFVYYGNQSALNVENPKKIFDFFDDFEGTQLNPAIWTVTQLSGTGAVTVSGGTVDVKGGTAGAVNLGNNVVLPATAAVYEARQKFITQSNKNRERWTPPNPFDYGIFHDGSNMKVYFNGFSATVITSNTYYRIKRQTSGSTFYWDIYDDSGSSVYSNSTSSVSNQNSINIASGDLGSNSQGGEIVMDVIFARKYAATEPSVGTPSSEEKSLSPVGYWRLDDGQGTSVKDSSGKNTLGTIAGATWQTEDLCVSGKCLNFDGTDDNVQITESSAVDLGATTDSYSVSAWVRTSTDFSANAVIVAKDDDSGTAPFDLYLNTSEQPCFSIGSGTSIACGPTSVSDGKWHQLIGVRDVTADQIYIYVDGLRVNALTDGTSGSLVNNDNVSIGNGCTSYTSCDFKGFIDEAKIYNYARSTDQIKLDYNSVGGSVADGAGTILGAQDLRSLSNGLVGYWKLDESSGSRSDSSGNGNTLTDTNSVTANPGKFAKAGQFTQSTPNYLEINDNASLSMGTGTSFTLSAWVYLDINSNEMPIIAKTGDTLGREYIMRYNSNGTSTFDCGNSGGSVNATNFGTISTSRWYFVSCWYDSTKQQIGISVNDGTPNLANSTDTVDLANRLGVGAELDVAGVGHSWDGRIDEARIYKRVLTPVERTQLFNFAPMPTGYWNFEEKSGTILNDRSGYGNNGTATGAVWSQGKFGSALSFNGSSDYINSTAAIDLTGTKVITVEFWLNWAAFANDDDVVMESSTNYNSNDGAFIIDPNASSGFVDIGIQDSVTTSKYRLERVPRPSSGAWHHWAIVLDNSTATGDIKAYIDGIEQATDININTKDQATGFGSYTWYVMSRAGTSLFGQGLMDEMKIYTYERTQKQVIVDMNGGHPAGGSPVGSQIGYWKFDEGNGTTAFDSSPTKANGTLTSMTSPASVTSGWNGNGRFGKSLSFDASDDYVSIPDNSALEGFSSMTVCSWVNLYNYAAGGHNNVIINKPTQAAGAAGSDPYTLWTLNVDNVNGKKAFFGIATATAGSRVLVFSKQDVPLRTWTHVCGVYDGSNAWVTVNGVPGNKVATTLTIGTNSQDIRIGAFMGSGGFNEVFNGMIDEVKIYNYALNTQDILIDYNRGQSVNFGVLGTSISDGNTASNSAASAYCVPGSTASCNLPVAQWSMEEALGNKNDTSGNESTLVNNNSVGSNPGKFGKASQFNAASSTYLSVADNAALSMGGTDFTVQGWFYIDTLASARLLMKARSDSAREYMLYVDGTGFIFGVGNDNVTTTNATTTGLTPVAGRWYFVTGWYDNTAKTVNIQVDNGPVFQTTGATTVVDSTGALNIGRNVAGNEYFSGRIDEVRIYKYIRDQAQRAYDFNRGLPVSWWKMDECQGTVLHDSVGTQSATLTIGTGAGTGHQDAAGTCTTNAATPWYNGRTGKYNYSINLDGIDDYVAVESRSHPVTIPTSNDWSIGAWIYPTALPNGFNEIYAEGHSSNTTQAFRFYVSSAGVLGLSLQSDQDNSYGATGPTTLTINNWYHVLVSKKGSVFSLCVNGICKATTSSLGSDTITFNRSTMGGITRLGGTTELFTGKIDEVKVWNYGLTNYQIRNDFNQGAAVRFGPSQGSP